MDNDFQRASVRQMQEGDQPCREYDKYNHWVRYVWGSGFATLCGLERIYAVNRVLVRDQDCKECLEQLEEEA